MSFRIGAIAATSFVLSLASGQANAEFKDQCTEAMKGQGPAFLVSRVCKCISEKTADSPELREELLALAPLSDDERDKQMSEELKAVRKSCRPI